MSNWCAEFTVFVKLDDKKTTTEEYIKAMLSVLPEGTEIDFVEFAEWE